MTLSLLWIWTWLRYSAGGGFSQVLALIWSKLRGTTGSELLQLQNEGHVSKWSTNIQSLVGNKSWSFLLRPSAVLHSLMCKFRLVRRWNPPCGF